MRAGEHEVAGLGAAVGIEERIAVLGDSLGPQERRAAEVILDHLSELAVFNSSELARMAGVSKATVSRLYRRLGFSGSAEVREQVRARRAAGTPIGAAGAPAVSDAGAVEILEAERSNLRVMLDGLSDGTLERVAASIAAARTVLVVGYRNAYPVALHLREQLVQARPGVRLAPEPGQSLGEELVGLGAGDVVLVAAFRRRPPWLGAAIGAAVASGAGVVVLGGVGADGLVAGAELLPCPVDGAGAFDSYAAAMTLVSLLANAVLGADIRAGRARIARIGELYRALDEIEG